MAKHTTEGDLWLILKNKNKGSDRYMVGEACPAGGVMGGVWGPVSGVGLVQGCVRGQPCCKGRQQ